MSYSRKIYEFITLQNGEEDKSKVLDNVRANVSFKGSNLWILACAIVIASVGLNVNSAAVIIGAMLISPLMGPIVGAGFALGTYNFELLKKSAKNLFVATIVGLVVSAIYFYISPFKETQSELLARTAPNIYDVMIAFFGGIVGAVAITRVEKGNPIPGVAIATALMPPLCTAGYGLAIGNLYYFLGAIYLYSINCFFICIATFIIIKYLKYPPIKLPDARYQKQVRYGISVLLIVMVVPSFYLAYNLYYERSFNNNVEKFIDNEFNDNGFTVIYKKLNFNSSPKRIEVAFLTKKFDSLEVAGLNKKLKEYQIEDAELFIRQDNEDIKKEILTELNTRNRTLSDKDITIGNLQKELQVYKFDNLSVLKEVNILFPEMKEATIGKQIFNQNSDSVKIWTVLIYKSEEFNEKKDSIVTRWLQQKLSTPDVMVIRQAKSKTKNQSANNK